MLVACRSTIRNVHIFSSVDDIEIGIVTRHQYLNNSLKSCLKFEMKNFKRQLRDL